MSLLEVKGLIPRKSEVRVFKPTHVNWSNSLSSFDQHLPCSNSWLPVCKNSCRSTYRSSSEKLYCCDLLHY